MCKTFSFISGGESNFFYFNHEQRQDMPILGKPDSHTTIAEYYNPGKVKNGMPKDDSVNKYEYDVFTKIFKVDQINVRDDQKEAEKWVKALNFKEIIPNIDFDKSFTEPLKKEFKGNIKSEEIDLLNQYVELRRSFEDQLWDQLRDQLKDQLGYRLREQLEDQLWKQLQVPLWDQFRNQLKDQFTSQFRNQLWDQLYSFGTTFVSDFKFKNETQKKLVNTINTLWEKGLLPIESDNKLYLFTLKDCKKVYEVSK